MGKDVIISLAVYVLFYILTFWVFMRLVYRTMQKEVDTVTKDYDALVIKYDKDVETSFLRGIEEGRATVEVCNSKPLTEKPVLDYRNDSTNPIPIDYYYAYGVGKYQDLPDSVKERYDVPIKRKGDR